MRFGLREDIIISIQDVFKNLPEIDKVILYGSRAKGNFKSASDIDLVLEAGKLKTADLNKISWILDDLLLPYTFDISLLHAIDNQELLDHIQRVGIVLYKKE